MLWMSLCIVELILPTSAIKTLSTGGFLRMLCYISVEKNWLSSVWLECWITPSKTGFIHHTTRLVMIYRSWVQPTKIALKFDTVFSIHPSTKTLNLATGASLTHFQLDVLQKRSHAETPIDIEEDIPQSFCFIGRRCKLWDSCKD